MQKEGNDRVCTALDNYLLRIGRMLTALNYSDGEDMYTHSLTPYTQPCSAERTALYETFIVKERERENKVEGKLKWIFKSIHEFLVYEVSYSSRLRLRYAF